ncbi:hypothetical protein CYMTET_5240 [Cymbomonas tetramitiformis]|uniref:WH2 domain-containing protein n=1 Tax=Cymbomonas tetramitiformis TaxID=36881 RepID=A0AAE0LJ98_9CHLO|nr:hypothetical protein CYMTET_5240 [Cymbomonas tetramitiformis]
MAAQSLPNRKRTALIEKVAGLAISNKEDCSDPFLVISKRDRALELGTGIPYYVPVARTERIDDNLDPKWRLLRVPFKLLCKGDLNTLLKIECFDCDDRRGVKKEHDKKLIASYLMPVDWLLKGNLSVPMTDYRDTPRMGGRLMHWKAPSIELEPTSLHLLHAGVRLSFGFAIDFSEAGVDAHSKYSGIGGNTHCNDILSAMMEHFTPLAGGRPMHVYGYGKEGSDCFSLQGPMQSFTLTSAQVVPAYNTILSKVKRSKEYGGRLGLTKEVHSLQPILANFGNIHHDPLNYKVLFVLTTGGALSKATTEALVAASTCPMSVFLVGMDECSQQNNYDDYIFLDRWRKELLRGPVTQSQQQRNIAHFSIIPRYERNAGAMHSHMGILHEVGKTIPYLLDDLEYYYAVQQPDVFPCDGFDEVNLPVTFSTIPTTPGTPPVDPFREDSTVAAPEARSATAAAEPRKDNAAQEAPEHASSSISSPIAPAAPPPPPRPPGRGRNHSVAFDPPSSTSVFEHYLLINPLLPPPSAPPPPATAPEDAEAADGGCAHSNLMAAIRRGKSMKKMTIQISDDANDKGDDAAAAGGTHGALMDAIKRGRKLHSSSSRVHKPEVESVSRDENPLVAAMNQRRAALMLNVQAGNDDDYDFDDDDDWSQPPCRQSSASAASSSNTGLAASRGNQVPTGSWTTWENGRSAALSTAILSSWIYEVKGPSNDSCLAPNDMPLGARTPPRAWAPGGLHLEYLHKFGEGGSIVQWAILTSSDTIYVVFRGSDSIVDGVIDLCYSPCDFAAHGVRVHSGMYLMLHQRVYPADDPPCIMSGS